MNRVENFGMSASDAGRKGSKALRAKYGSEFFSEIGQKGGEALRDRVDPDYFSKLGRKGGLARARRHSGSSVVVGQVFGSLIFDDSR